MKHVSLNLNRLANIYTVSIVACLLYAFLDPGKGFEISSYLNLVGGLIFLTVGIAVFIKTRRRHTLIYMLAFGVLILTVILANLQGQNLIPFLSHHLMFYGMTIENIIMLFALGFRIYETEQERLNSLRHMHHSYQQLEKIYYPHQILHIESGKHLEDSMPIGKGNACVISFDVAASSQMDSDDAKDFFRSIFARCGQIMSENYQAKPLQANAFRVKEMGDGFLCTTGFPLQLLRKSIRSHC